MAPEYVVAGWFQNARVADQNGLVPRGETLTAIVADFLQQPDVSGESTVLGSFARAPRHAGCLADEARRTLAAISLCWSCLRNALFAHAVGCQISQ